MSAGIWQKLQTGECPEPWTFGPLTVTDFVRYQGASGDMNPVHHDAEFAQGAGFPGPLAVGMFAAGAMNSYATRWLGAENVRGTRVRWKKPAFAGYEMTVSAEVARTWEEGAEKRVELALSVTDSEGDLSLQGWMIFVVPDATGDGNE